MSIRILLLTLLVFPSCAFQPDPATFLGRAEVKREGRWITASDRDAGLAPGGGRMIDAMVETTVPQLGRIGCSISWAIAPCGTRSRSSSLIASAPAGCSCSRAIRTTPASTTATASAAPMSHGANPGRRSDRAGWSETSPMNFYVSKSLTAYFRAASMARSRSCSGNSKKRSSAATMMSWLVTLRGAPQDFMRS